MVSSSKSYCVLPYVSFTTTVNGNVVKPCCRWEDQDDDTPISLKEFSKDPMEILRNGVFKHIRDSQAKNKIPQCNKCYFDEDHDKVTMRQHHNELFNFVNSNTYEKTRRLELGIDSLCNLECRMCNSGFSTKLYNRDMTFGLATPQKLTTPDLSFLDKIDLSELSELKIIGGEPFLSPNLETLIDKIDPKNVFIELATNGTVIPSDSVIQKLKKFKRVHISISLDAVHPINDYQRTHSSYKNILENAIRIRERISSGEFTIWPVIGIYNANVMPQTKSYVEKLGFRFRYGWIYGWASLENVPHYYIDWLLDCVKDTEFEEHYKKYFEKNRYDKNKWNFFLEMTKKLDAYYDINLKDYNPELAEVLHYDVI